MTKQPDALKVPAPVLPPASLYIICGASIVLFAGLVNLMLYQL